MIDKVQKIRSYLADMANADGAITVVAKAINKKILPYIDSLQEELVSEDLAQAIDTYLATYFGSEKEKQDWPFLKKMAIHFANWQKEQIMKDALDAVVKIDAGGYPYVNRTIELYDYDKDIPLAKRGDKVKILVIKED